MNVSQPVSSHVRGIEFSVLSPSEIRALSAKRITSSTTFDTLLNPIPGGLYTPELGQFGDNACATCALKTPQCPGHCGHIELPVPCYHPTFLDQLYRLLRGTCIYCHRLRLKRTQLRKYIYKLKLVRNGLLKEARDFDTLAKRQTDLSSKRGTFSALGERGEKNGKIIDQEDAELAAEEESDDDEQSELERYERIFRVSIADAGRDGTFDTQKTEAKSHARQQIIMAFLKDLTMSRKCGNCSAINPIYRKDRSVKVFRKSLSEKERQANIQGQVRVKNAVVQLRKRALSEKARTGSKRKYDDIDEGVADLETSAEAEDEDEESEDEHSEDTEDEPEIVGGVIENGAGEGKAKKKKIEREEEYLNPTQVFAELELMFEREQEILSLIYGGTLPYTKRQTSGNRVSAEMFFMRDILVPPNRYRPEARTGNNEIAEAQENTLYKNILNSVEKLTLVQRELTGEAERNANFRKRTMVDLENGWTVLQDAVNSLVNRELNPMQGPAARRNPDGIKQKLEKKEGMFRKYMMGKRVNFAARTVISPDPNIETNEIGVPPVFAHKLTYPEPVTHWNVEELQEAVRNGPHVWPGAVAIESENGQVVNLERKNPEERTALANQLLAPSTITSGIGARGTRPKKVHRHLNNGDIVIMNRQPTLHKPSMMCHRARILPGEKTLRMHYANCNTYNADFDGDEMNLHFPQNELARSEALSIADTDNQYLSSTAGNPLRGLIQDHISMGVWLSNRDTFFDKEKYMQLLYAALRPENGHCTTGRLITLPPAVFKPKKLWTGKQVVSTILKNMKPDTHQDLTMAGRSTTEARFWGSEGAEESSVLFQDGYFCHGVLDKKQIGPSSGGFVNAVYEAYGHTLAGRLLSVLGRLLTRLLQERAFSCGVEDIIFTRDGEMKRRDALAGVDMVGLGVAKKYVNLDQENLEAGDRELKRRMEDVLRDDSKQHGLDLLVNNATKDLSSAVTKACLPAALAKPFPKNQMQAMTVSGAKGSSVNANQISCNLGQQVLEGRRVPVMVSGKTLPSFRPFEPSVRAGGYIVDRFLTGVRPEEYVFHAMAGREGLIDTAVKTSRSGYLQRCLIKGMEGLRVEYDTTVRETTDGSIIQFLYGEDGLDVAKAKYLSDHKFAAENYLSLFHSFGMREHFDKVASPEAIEHNKSAEKKFRKSNDLAASDPALAIYPPAKHVGSTSEKVFRAAKDYVDNNPDKLIRDKKKNIEGVGVTKKNFQAILDLRYLKSVVEAGEAVGVVAGQSIGEPSTQMTLNTFHLAGHSAKNVTLGIPRLREIIMTAASTGSMATPTMTLRLNEDINLEDARSFSKGLSRLSLAEIIDKVTLTERQEAGMAYQAARKYEVRLDLFPRAEYEKTHAITMSDVLSNIEFVFLPDLQALARKEIKKRGDEKSLKAQIGESAGLVEQESNRPEAEAEGGADDSDGEGDDDATRDKAKNNKQQAGYEAMDDEEETARAPNGYRADPIEPEMEDEAYGGSPRSGPTAEELAEMAADAREQRIKERKKSSDVLKFYFDDKTGDVCTFTFEYDAKAAKILMLNLVEEAARTSLIQQVSGIASCIVNEDPARDDKHVQQVVASGVNIRAMWPFQHVVDPHHIYTNSVREMLNHYGVEAARATIVLELQSVFSAHGIAVDVRHLTLIADFMTRQGDYQSFSRTGYRNNTSPFMKMSFETTLAFLKDAVLSGDWEELTNPSARICVGGLSSVGTGGFDVLLPLEQAEGEAADDGAWEESGGEEDRDGDMMMGDASS